MWIVEILHRAIVIASQNGFENERHCRATINRLCNDPAFDGLTFRHFYQEV